MKKVLLALLLLPVITYSQSKRKKRPAGEKARTELLSNIKTDMQHLTDSSFQQYIIQQYQQIGLEPKGGNGYIQDFEINEGKQVDTTTALKIDGRTLRLMKDYIPLAFSATKTVRGSAAMALNEYKQPWFKDIRDLLEENKDNLKFNLEASIKKEITKSVAKGATALFVYNSSVLTDSIRFNRFDRSPAAVIPVVYITKEGLKNHFQDNAATVLIELTVGFSEKQFKARNLVGFIDNHAASTVLLSTSANNPGTGTANAAGAAALIELARILRKGAFAGNNYLIMNFYARQQEPVGIQYWLAHPTVVSIPRHTLQIDHSGDSRDENDIIKLVNDVIGNGDQKGKLSFQD